MKKIIVPTDFSFASKDAYVFALQIAEKLKVAVEVVHIYSGSFNTQRPYSLKAGMGRYESLMDDLKYFTKLEGVTKKMAITSQVPILIYHKDYF